MRLKYRQQELDPGSSTIAVGRSQQPALRLQFALLKQITLLLLCVLILGLLAACSASRPAPVISREQRPRAEESSYQPQATSGNEHTVVTAYQSQDAAPMPIEIAPKPLAVTPKPQEVAPKPQVATGPSAYYTVRHGDTLYSTAWRLGVDYRDLAAWNDIKPPYTIYAGQRIRVKPGQRKRVIVAQQTPQQTTSSSTVTTAQQKSNPTDPKPAVVKPQVERKEIPSVKLRWQWPTNGKVVQAYSSKDMNRKGIKIAGERGQKITSSEAGKVVYVGDGLIGYGQLIIIKHNKEYLSAYGYNRKLLVKEGDEVDRGEHIAEMGDGGSGRAQLHFEVRRNGVPVDPIALLPRR